MNRTAYELGLGDGEQMARERIAEITAPRPIQIGEDEFAESPIDLDAIRALSGAKNFDEALINAVGFTETAKAFGLSPNGATWQDACDSYEAGATKGWEDEIAFALSALS